MIFFVRSYSSSFWRYTFLQFDIRIYIWSGLYLKGPKDIIDIEYGHTADACAAAAAAAASRSSSSSSSSSRRVRVVVVSSRLISYSTR